MIGSNLSQRLPIILNLCKHKKKNPSNSNAGAPCGFATLPSSECTFSFTAIKIVLS